MAEADSKTTTPTRQWVTLADYAQRKIDETVDRDIAYGLIVQELARESEGLLPYRYKRSDDVEGRWYDDGLPVGYWWRDARINWQVSSARWSERIAPGVGLLLELQIYRIEVAAPVETAAEPEPVAPAPADESIPEPHHAAMLADAERNTGVESVDPSPMNAVEGVNPFRTGSAGRPSAPPQPDASCESEPPLDGKLGVTVRAIDALVNRGVAFDASGEEARRIAIETAARRIAEDTKLLLSSRTVRLALAHRKKWPHRK